MQTPPQAHTSPATKGRTVDPDDLAGLAEAVDILSLTNGTILALLAKDPTFPQPVKRLRSGRLWLASELREWQAARTKRPGGRQTRAELVARGAAS